MCHTFLALLRKCKNGIKYSTHTPNLGVCFFAVAPQTHKHTTHTRYLMSQTKRRTPATNPHRQNARHNQNCALKTKSSFAKGQVTLGA